MSAEYLLHRACAIAWSSVLSLRARLMCGVLVVVAACGRDEPAAPNDSDVGASVSIRLPNGARVDTLAVGAQLQLALVPASGGTPPRGVTWSSDPATVASVSSSGLVTALAPGGATITATKGTSADTVWIVMTSPAVVALPVFPGANGFGITTPAGRRGAVLRVTNLDDRGPGSLRSALEAPGARTIIFDVGGTITLTTRIRVTQPFVTVAGHSAPAPGITLRGAGLRIQTHDVLIQHLRVRVGDGPGDDPLNRDAIEILGPNGHDIVVDHVSLSWATDENFSTWYNGVHDVTLSNSIVSEGLGGVEDAFGVLVGDSTRNFALIGSLLAHNAERNPYFKGATSGIAANNVVYDWTAGAAMLYGDPEGAGPTQFALVANVGIRGPNSSGSRIFGIANSAKTGTRAYIADNSDTRVNDGVAPADQWTLVRNEAGASVVATTAPVWPGDFTPLANRMVYATVLANAGAWPTARDAVDARVLNEVRNGTGRIVGSPAQVGGWPDLGMQRRALTLPPNPNGDDDSDGYTNLEEWLHALARAAEGR